MDDPLKTRLSGSENTSNVGWQDLGQDLGQDGRRAKQDRRQNKLPYSGPERRSPGRDRRQFNLADAS